VELRNSGVAHRPAPSGDPAVARGSTKEKEKCDGFCIHTKKNAPSSCVAVDNCRLPSLSLTLH